MDAIISKDGTRIAYEKSENGPAFILIDGAFCSKDFGPMVKLAPELSKHFTVFSYDRRARGESGDTHPYDKQREIEDIEALINTAGGLPLYLQYRPEQFSPYKRQPAACILKKLALLESPFVGNSKGDRATNAFKQLSQLIAKGKKAEACKFYLRKVIGLSAILPFFLSFT